MKKSTLVALAICCFGGCNEYSQLTKQTSTFADMQNISREMYDYWRRNDCLSEETFVRIVSRYNGGKDRWGNNLIFRYRSEPTFSFLVVSPGRDGLLDVTDIGVYFDMPRVDIVGQLDRDIVFRDGAWVTKASPK